MPREFIKRLRGNNIGAAHHSHKNKKYFSLMLIPSYSFGKTRSIRISINTLYMVFFAAVAAVIIIAALYIRSDFLRQMAEDFSVSLEQAQITYASLQRAAELEQIQLTQGVFSLRADLTGERMRTQEELRRQQQIYIESLEAIWVYAEDLEMRLRRYEEYRQEIIGRLSESAHIPIVNNILDDIQESQLHLLSAFEELPGYANNWGQGQAQTIQLLNHSPNASNPVSPDEMTTNLIHYIAALELALEAQAELFTELQQQVRVAAPHIRRDRYGPRLLEWSYVRNILPRNTPVMVTDVRTGTTYWISSFSHGNHADVVPVSAEDTAALLRTFNGRWSWDTRPIWVHIGDRKVAASINGMPHGGGGGRANNMNGHICIHFSGSRTHSGSRAHERDHQNSVMQAYRADF